MSFPLRRKKRWFGAGAYSKAEIGKAEEGPRATDHRLQDEGGKAEILKAESRNGTKGEKLTR
jgi:hypothetical protein